VSRTLHQPASALGPSVAVVFAAFVVVGAAIPVLPLHVTGALGMSPFVVGLVSGAQFAAALISRLWSGSFADRRGGKAALLAGLLVSTIAGFVYLASTALVAHPTASVVVLVIGRAVLGAGESFVVTGALMWGLAAAGAGNTGKVMSWVGMAMYVGFALGGPIGAALYGWAGFVAISVATIVVPACALLGAWQLPVATQPRDPGEASDSSVLSAVWLPGLALAFASVGFGTLTTFAPLLLREHQWGATWTAFTVFSIAFVIARLLLSHLPDRVGGAKVALACVIVEATGQWLVWQADGLPAMLAGSALTGLGYALVYPALGVEAVKRAPARSKALAMGTYTAFLDLMLGVGSPALGFIAGRASVRTVFAVGAVSAVVAALLAIVLHVRYRHLPKMNAAA
jgi:MFS family permease